MKTDKDPNWVNCKYILQYSCQKSSLSTFRNGNDTSTAKFTKSSNRENTETYAEKIARKAADVENSKVEKIC